MGTQYSFLNRATASTRNLPQVEVNMISDPQQTGTDSTMSAIVYSRHGTSDECVEIVHNLSRPRQSAGQVLVKVHAYGINPLDIRLLDNPNHGKPSPWRV